MDNPITNSNSIDTASSLAALSLTDMITLVGILLTFAVSVCSLVIEIKSGKMSRYSNVISRIRSDWIYGLRLETGDFIKVAINCIKDTEDWDSNFALLKRGAFIVKSHLGPKFDDYASVVDEIAAFVMECHNYGLEIKEREEKFDILLEKLYVAANNCYGVQWAVIKHEALDK